MSAAPVDVLAVMDALWLSRASAQEADYRQARAAVAELVRLVDYAKDTHPEGCFREDCAAALARVQP